MKSAIFGLATLLCMWMSGYEAEARFIIPFCRWPKPEDLKTINPTLWARSRNYSQKYSISVDDDIQSMTAQLQSQNLTSKKTVFLVHGFTDGVNSKWLTNMTNALLAIQDYLVVTVGWDKGADLYLDYPLAASNTQTVATAVAVATKSLKDAGSPYTYCIGHSLGAHICGQAGDQFSFDRISGLDPAGPGFENCSHTGLTSSSAKCVDVIHTNGEWDGFGTLEQLGHVDFYPNCGRSQPSCNDLFQLGCSHVKAIDYFMDSVNAFDQTPAKCPTGEGPCVGDFVNECTACGTTDCPTTQKQCQATSGGARQQPMGYGSMCHEQKKPGRLSNVVRSADDFEGQWFVPVSSSGFLTFSNAQ
jgi:hypothetical protein